MKPIEPLTALDTLRRELRCQREKIASLEEAARYLSPVSDGIGGSGGPSDKVGKMAGQIADERTELERLEEKYAHSVAKAAKILNRLSDPLEREALAKRYIAGMSWNAVAQKMGYSYRAVQRIKKKSLQKLSYDVL